MYRPPIGPVSAIERAIVCMQCPDLADLRQPISRGFLHTATSGDAPGFFSVLGEVFFSSISFSSCFYFSSCFSSYSCPVVWAED
jgi:hypothetical protein